MIATTPSIENLGEIIRSYKQLLPGGCRTKTGLYPADEVEILDLSGLNGIVEYQPEEFTITAQAGTPLIDVVKILEKNKQYLPFDPPLINHGATLGGTIAAGLSGSGRFRYGGIRDFILGIKFLDGQGKLIRAGGRVVKNAAGFDIAKLMVGSLGSLGAITEVSFKVFPLPEDFITLIKTLPNLEDCVDLVRRLSSQPVEIHCLDIDCTQQKSELVIRLAGNPDIFPSRISPIIAITGNLTIIDGEEERNYWSIVNEFGWLDDRQHLVKVPIILHEILPLHKMLSDFECKLRYVAGGNLAWIGCDDTAGSLDKILKELNLVGLIILGKNNQARIGKASTGTFYTRIKTAFDPQNRWVEVR